MINSTFQPDRNAYVIKIWGAISVPELVAEYDSIFQDEKFQSNMHGIWDLSGLNLTSIPIGDVRQLPGELRRYMEQRGDDYKAALVVRNGADFQLLRIYLTILRLIGSNIRFRLFRSLNEAYAWIDEGSGND